MRVSSVGLWLRVWGLGSRALGCGEVDAMQAEILGAWIRDCVVTLNIDVAFALTAQITLFSSANMRRELLWMLLNPGGSVWRTPRAVLCRQGRGYTRMILDTPLAHMRARGEESVVLDGYQGRGMARSLPIEG